MTQRCTTRAEFCQAIQGIAGQFAEALWATVVERGSAGADVWVRTHGSAWLRQALGVALRARAERLGVSGTCACGSAVTFRQHRPTRVHTVLPGRDVEATVLYGQCRACQRGSWPVLTELRVDAEGFTPALQALATLASVIEPYETASTELLGRMAGVHVSTEKMQALVREEGTRATETLTAPPPESEPVGRSAMGPLTVGIDGGMVFVDQRWQEVKLACLYDVDDRVVTPTRGLLTRRAVSHVVQQRMKRVGMRWRSAGADAMLALRSIYRSTGAWDRFWTTPRVA